MLWIPFNCLPSCPIPGRRDHPVALEKHIHISYPEVRSCPRFEDQRSSNIDALCGVLSPFRVRHSMISELNTRHGWELISIATVTTLWAGIPPSLLVSKKEHISGANTWMSLTLGRCNSHKSDPEYLDNLISHHLGRRTSHRERPGEDGQPLGKYPPPCAFLKFHCTRSQCPDYLRSSEESTHLCSLDHISSWKDNSCTFNSLEADKKPSRVGLSTESVQIRVSFKASWVNAIGEPTFDLYFEEAEHEVRVVFFHAKPSPALANIICKGLPNQ